MPHVIVKLWPGKTEKQKTRLAMAITKNVTEILGYGDDSVSVAMEEVGPQDWAECTRLIFRTSETISTKSPAIP
jgi:4-oxalocrotonate tautomerase